MSKKDIVKYIIDEYGVTSPTDITNALKDLLGETLQDMLNSEFDEHMGYDKYDQNYLHSQEKPPLWFYPYTADYIVLWQHLLLLYKKPL